MIVAGALALDGAVLATYTPSEPPTQDAAMAAEKALEKMRSDISALPLDLHCSEEDDLIHLELQIATKEKHVLLPDGVRCFVRAITVPNERGYDVGRSSSRALLFVPVAREQ